MDIQRLQKRLREFTTARDWEQFHSPKNLAMALVAEVGELVEQFQCRPRSRGPLVAFCCVANGCWSFYSHAQDWRNYSRDEVITAEATPKPCVGG